MLLNEMTLIIYDTETSGPFVPLAEVIEVGALKYKAGKLIDKLQILIKPERPVPDDIIAIHHITNEALLNAPSAKQVAPQIESFFKDGDLFVAHHAPFDMALMAHFFESTLGRNIETKAMGACTSLLARQLIKGVENHKLQTLVKHFSFEGGQAHRALDDAISCYQVFCKCIELFNSNRENSNRENISSEDIFKKQGYRLPWSRFGLLDLNHSWWPKLNQAIIQNKSQIQIKMGRGLLKNQWQQVKPLGVVRTPVDGDYVAGFSILENKKKRFHMADIIEIKVD